MSLSADDRASLRTSTLQARNTMHPHGDGCWRVHWPCRCLLLLDELQDTATRLEFEKAAHMQEVSELRAINDRINQRSEGVLQRLAAHQELLAGHREAMGRLLGAADQLDEGFRSVVQEQARFLIGAYHKLLAEHQSNVAGLESRLKES